MIAFFVLVFLWAFAFAANERNSKTQKMLVKFLSILIFVIRKMTKLKNNCPQSFAITLKIKESIHTNNTNHGKQKINLSSLSTLLSHSTTQKVKKNNKNKKTLKVLNVRH